MRKITSSQVVPVSDVDAAGQNPQIHQEAWIASEGKDAFRELPEGVSRQCKLFFKFFHFVLRKLQDACIPPSGKGSWAMGIAAMKPNKVTKNISQLQLLYIPAA